MNDGTQVCEHCGQPLPDERTGADITRIREAAGIDTKTLSEHLGDVKPRTLTGIETGKKPYPSGLYARCEQACRSIVSSRAAALGLFPSEAE